MGSRLTKTMVRTLVLLFAAFVSSGAWAAAVGDTVTWTNADGLSANDVVNANHCSFSLQLPETAGLAKGSVVCITNVQIASINSQRVSNSSNNQNDPHSISIGNTRSSEVSFITSETLAGKYIDSYNFSNGVEVEVGKKYGESWGAHYTQFAGCGVTFLHSNGNRWSGGSTMNCTVGGTTAGAIANGTTVFPIYKITATVVAVAQNVERTIAANANTTWDAAEWTVGGVAAQAFVPSSDIIYNVTITVGGDCTVTMPATIGSFRTCNVNFVLDSGAQAATVTLKYAGTLPSDSATTANLSPFGSANVTAGEGVTLTPVYEEDTTGYVTQISGVNYYAAKRPNVGVVSVRIGARTAEASGGNILNTPYSNVGPYPVSGLLWNQTKLWNNNSTSGTYTDIQNLADAKDGSSAVRIAYYGHNTYYNSNAATLPNMVLTKTYLDDSDSGNGNLTATDGNENITLPTPGHNRGWQLHFENIPYNAYDVYFITASDVENGNLKETPIYVSLDGGSTWKSYCGDSTNQKTVMGTDPWTGLPYAQNGVLVHGKNYIKMRITKSIYGDNIGTIDITHGTRNTGSSIRSGLAAIQIVEVQNDGVYTLADSGNWSDAIWNVGNLTEQNWTDTVDGTPSIAKIVSSEDVSSVAVDAAVSAGEVILTGSNPFAVVGASTLTVGTGFDASGFSGTLNLQAPISGTVYLGANTDLTFGGDSNVTLPSYTLDGSGSWRKVGSGVLTVNSALGRAGTVEAGSVALTASSSDNLTLNGGDVAISGGTYSGSLTVGESGSSNKTIINGNVTSSGSINTPIDVENGATLTLGGRGGFGSGSNGAIGSGKAITVKSGGTIELNGFEGCNAYTLAGGTLQNTVQKDEYSLDTDHRQTTGLTLTANSTVHAGYTFGLVGNGHGPTTIDLGSHTLTKTGSGSFILYNTTVSNGGSLSVSNGSLDAYGTVTVPAVSIASGASFVLHTASVTAGELSGAGTVDINTQRPSNTLTFANGNNLTLHVTLASTGEASVSIPVSGAPANVVVYEPDGSTVCSVATVDSSTPGTIAISVDIASSVRVNPVTGADVTFGNAFFGTTDGAWGEKGNWKIVSNNRWVAYAAEYPPAYTSSGQWGSNLFDGDLMAVAADANGYKNVTTGETALEGWALKVGLFNHARVSINQVVKVQGETWYIVDATSQLVLGTNNRDGDQGSTGDVKMYVAAANGIIFTSDYNYYGAGTISYYFSGAGSVNYSEGITRGTHKIMSVRLTTLGTETKLVALKSDAENVTFDCSEATVTDSEGTPVAYTFEQKADGVYVTGRTAVAKRSNETRYATLQSAIDAASSGETITLLAANAENITLSDKTIVFAENGFAFSGTLTGTGTIRVNTAPSATTWAAARFVSEGWTGTFIVGWDMSGKMMPDKYGISGSKVEVATEITSGYFNIDSSSLGAPSIAPALYFDEDVTINDGFGGSSAQITTFSQVGMADEKTFKTRGNGSSATPYTFTTIKDFGGTLQVRANDIVTLGTFVRATVPACGELLMKLTKDEEGSTLNLAGVQVKVGSSAAVAFPVVYGTVEDVSGIVANYVATITKDGLMSYYATIQAAIDAAEGAGDSLSVIAVADNEAVVPAGYYIDNGTVCKYQAAIVDDSGDVVSYYASAQAAVNAIAFNWQTYDHVEVFYGTDVEVRLNNTWQSFSAGYLKIKCLNASTVDVDASDAEFMVSASDPEDGVVSYTYTIRPMTYTWGGSDGALTWARPQNWRYGDAQVANRAVSEVDSIVLNQGAEIIVGADASAKGVIVNGAVTLSNGVSVVTLTATTDRIVLAAAGASVTVSGVTLSPTPTTSVADYVVRTTGGGDDPTVYTAVLGAAKIGDTLYETLAEAIAAAGDANLASITVLDGSAAVPDGYYIDNGVVCKYQAAIVDSSNNVLQYFATAQDATDAIDTYRTTYRYFALYYGTDVAVTIDLTKLTWRLNGIIRFKCDNGSSVVVTIESTEYQLSAGDPDGNGIITYSKVAKAATYYWTGALPQKQWGRSGNWVVGAVDGETATRAPTEGDTVILDGSESSVSIDSITQPISLASLSVSGTVSFAGSSTLTSDSAIALPAGASIAVTGVTLSPEPTVTDTTNYRIRKTESAGTTTYTVVEKVGTIFSVY